MTFFPEAYLSILVLGTVSPIFVTSKINQRVLNFESVQKCCKLVLANHHGNAKLLPPLKIPYYFFRYLVEGVHALDRLLWLVLLLLAFSFAGFFVWEALEEWRTSPIITTIGSPAKPIQEIQVCKTNVVSFLYFVFFFLDTELYPSRSIYINPQFLSAAAVARGEAGNSRLCIAKPSDLDE